MNVRASDAEREETVERLRAAAAEGRLTFEELADRIEAASGAVMRSDLVPLTADLPAETLPEPRAAAPMEVSSLGDIKRSGAWIVPAESRIRSWLGNVQLDLRQAHISEREIRIHAWTLFGTVDLLVPEGVNVDFQGSTHLGTFKLDAGAPPAPGAPRIVLTGGTVFGTVRVRHRRLWEKLARRLGELS